jgi:monoamine oxidase
MAVRISDTRSRGLAIEDTQNQYKPTPHHGSVLIVGAGVAGMYAAHLLAENGFEVTVLEASENYGGRIRTLENFANFPIELGAEEIHGENSIYYQIMQTHDIALFDSTIGKNYYLIDEELVSEESARKNPDFVKALELIASIEQYDGSEISLQEYMDIKHIKKNVQHIVNAELANERGTSANRIGMKGLAQEFVNWAAGKETFMLKNRSHLSVLKNHFSRVIDKIHCNQAVKAIDYSENFVNVLTEDGKTYQADMVIVTAPLMILKANLINFYPALPKEKEVAIQHIGMGTGMKIILKFKKQFWSDDTASIFGQLIPEYWVTSYQRSNVEHILTAFVNGQNAEFLSHQGAEAINAVLNELDNMFGVGVASTNLEKFYIMDWGKEPFVRGTYSFDKMGIGNSREILAKSVNDVIFFAGEATCTNGHHASIHGAMESAERVVGEIKEILNKA